MTEINPAGWFQNRADHSASQLRMYLGGMLDQHKQFGEAHDFGPPLGGVHPSRQMAVRPNSPVSMTVVVDSGIAYIPGTEAPTQGTYVCVNDGDVTLPIATSDPSLTRIDLVIAHVLDSQYSGAVNAWALEVVTGTPGAGDPVVPNNSLALAKVTIPAAATAITASDISEDVKRYVSGVGGFQAWPSQAAIESSSLLGLDAPIVSGDLPIPVSYIDLATDSGTEKPVRYKYYDGTFSSGFLTTDVAGLGLYSGVIYTGTATLVSTTTTETNIPALTLPPPARTHPTDSGMYWGKVKCFVRSTVAGDRVSFRIRTVNPAPGGVFWEEFPDFYIPVANVLFPVTFDYLYRQSGLPGGSAYLSVLRVAGSGTITVVGKGGFPGTFRGASWHLLYNDGFSGDISFTN